MKKALSLIFTLLLVCTGCLICPPQAAAAVTEAEAAFTVEDGVLQQYLAAQAGETLGFDAAKSYLTDQLLQGKTRIDLSAYQIPASVFVEVDGSIGAAFQSYLFATSVLFHLNKYQAPSLEQENGLVTALLPLYALAEPELSETLSRYNAELERALSCIEPGMSRLDKALAIHDYLALNYSYRSSAAPSVPEAQMQCIILNKYGNCYAYTRAYEYLLNKSGVPCARALSLDLVHIWNQVQLDDGSWYHVDVTWDDPLPDIIGRVEHQYFLLSDSAMLSGEHSCTDMERSYAADSTKYDNAPWRSASSQIISQDGRWYYVDSAYKKTGQKYPSGAILQYDPSQPQTAPRLYHEMGTPWMDFGQQMYWNHVYSGFGLYQNKLYYQSMDTIYTVPLPETPDGPLPAPSPSARYFRERAAGFYYGMYIEDNILWYAVGTYNGDAQNRYQLDLSQSQFTVTYEVGEGQGAPPAQSRGVGQPLTLSTQRPTRDGYQFLGWALAPGQAARFQPGESFPYEQDQTFYAAWQQNRVEVEGLLYVINSDHAVLVGYSDNLKTGEPHIQSSVAGKPVTAIGYRAFYAKSGRWNYWLTKLVIPDTVTSIGEQACCNCLNLKQVIFPDSVLTIGQSAFENCSAIENLQLPANLQETGMMAFYNASTNKMLEIPVSLTKMGDYLFGRQKTVQEFRVHPDNPAYCSQDGVLFNKDKTILIAYPMSNPRTAYQVPSTVKMVYCLSFANPNHYGTVPLKMIYLPQPNPLQAMGYTFDQMGRGKPFVIYGMQATKLWRQVVDWQIAFTSIDFRDTAYGDPPRFVESVTISGGSTIPATASLQLSAVALPGDAFDTSVYWLSSDPALATVDQKGVVTGVAPGQVTITAYALDHGYVASEEMMFATHAVTVTTAATQAELDACDVQFIRDRLSFCTFAYAMSQGNTPAEILALAEAQVSALELKEVTVAVTVGESFTPAQAGTLPAPAGTAGRFELHFQLTKNSASGNLSLPGRISPTVYVARPQISISASALEVVRGESVVLTAETVDIHQPTFIWYQNGFFPFGYEYANTGSVNTVTIDTGNMKGKQRFGVLVNDKESEFITITVKDPFVSVADFSYLPQTMVSGLPLTLSGQVAPTDATCQDIYWEVSENNTLPGVELADTLLVANEPGLLLLKATVINGAVDEAGNRCNYSQEFQVQVVERYVPVTGVEGVPSRITAQKWVTLPAYASPDNATCREIVWSLPEENAKYGSRVENGRLWSEHESISEDDIQKAVVIATIKDGGGPGLDYSQVYYISVDEKYNAVESVSGLPTAMTAGTPLTLSAQIGPEGALSPYTDVTPTVTKSLAWAVSPRNLLPGLTIENGKLYASRGGQAHLQLIISNGLAAGEDFVQEFTVSVFMPVSGLTGLPTQLTANTPLTLSAVVQPFDATNQTLTWAVAPDNTLDGLSLDDGVLTAAHSGSARLLVSVAEGLGPGRAYQQTVTVAVLPNLRIDSQPASLTVQKGAAARFTVVTAGDPAPTCQWQVNRDGQWRDLSGETGAELLLPAAGRELNLSRYRCVISNSTGSLTSGEAVLTVLEAPYTLSEPADCDLAPGAAATFRVEAGGNPAPGYQWQRLSGGVWQPIAGADSAVYTLNDAETAWDGQSFRCRLTNSVGTTYSRAAVLSVGMAPQFSGQPQSLTVSQGQPAAFNAATAAYPPARYQWQSWQDGAWHNLTAATASAYTIDQAGVEQAGLRLRCLASNRYGTTVSAEAVLTVILKPLILRQPVCGAFALGTFPPYVEVTARDSGTMTYTWETWDAASQTWSSELGHMVTGADNGYPQLLYIYNAELSDQGRQYRCRIGNEAGEAISDTITIQLVDTFVAVSGIGGVPTSLRSGQSLSGQVQPATASNQTIHWSVSAANTLAGLTIHDNILTAPVSGLATVTATVYNGTKASARYEPYSQDFAIQVTGEDHQTLAYCQVDGEPVPDPAQLCGGETVSVSLQLANTQAEARSIQFLLAVYREGRLLALYTPPSLTAAPGGSGQLEDYTFTLPPDCADCQLICYAWEALSTLQPLVEPVALW